MPYKKEKNNKNICKKRVFTNSNLDFTDYILITVTFIHKIIHEKQKDGGCVLCCGHLVPERKPCFFFLCKMKVDNTSLEN